MNQKSKKIVLSGLFIALGIILPFLTGQIPAVGSRLLPMHLPVLLCGFICGGPYGLVVGLVTPILRSLLFTMPPMFPTAIAMSVELAVYGLVAGALFNIKRDSLTRFFVALIAAMVAGRIAWGLVMYLLLAFGGNAFTLGMFMTGAVINALPGIVLQLFLIPLLVNAVKKTGLA